MASSIDKLSQLAGLGGATGGATGGTTGGATVERKSPAPMSVYLLADHLDAALAAGEDLLRQGFSWHAANPCAAQEAELEREAMRECLQKIRSLELTLISRVMRAREHAEMLGKRDPRFKLMATLFASGTVTLLDAVAALGDTTNHNFETGDVTTAYLRSRGLLEAEAAAPNEGSVVSVTDEFLVAARIRAGVLLDMVAMFLDTLETHYDLFAADVRDEEALPAAQVAAAPVASAAVEDEDSEENESEAAGRQDASRDKEEDEVLEDPLELAVSRSAASKSDSGF